MKLIARLLTVLLLMACVSAHTCAAADNPFIAANDVTWSSLGRDENESMPIGNGDLAANVWTEQNGDLLLLVAKDDAWTELGKLVKLGRVRIHLDPDPFTGATDFTQSLRLEDGSILIKSGANTLEVWVDAHRPAIHVEARLEQPAAMRASVELWRTAHPFAASSPDRGGMFELGGGHVPINFEADTVLPASSAEIAWCHFNPDSVYPLVLQQEHLDSLLAKYPDPLLHRCFGATLSGPGLVTDGNQTLKSSRAEKNLRLDLVALTEAPAASPEAWRADLDTLVKQVNDTSLKHARTATRQWWQDFWDRSWVHVAGTTDAAKVSQGYVMQRYLIAASSRGAFPVKFNGGLFTVGHDLPADQESNGKNHNADFREWGNSYWNQNNRLLYWPLVATGDFDLLKPWFDMYLRDLPLAKDRTQIYFHHDGASLPETMLFWGLPNLTDFGWDNPTFDLQSHWQRYHIQGTLEVIAQMLVQYDITQDADFARNSIVPFADAIVTYYGQHWPRDADGKIRMSPAQSIETYQLDAVNPTPDIAGLKSVLPRLIDLPDDLATVGQRDNWKKILADLPPIPMGKTAHGKLPPLGNGDPDGTPTILPAEKYGKTCNGENPELYVVFPYRLYGVGEPGLALARNTFAARLFPQDTCWGQDGMQAALLGLTGVAKKAATREFTDYGDERFPWFWKAGHDWIPDFDNGGAGMTTLQLMLMQCDGKRIQLLPAWPKDWTADFKLHAPYQTTVEAHVENGQLTHLKVTPKSRAKDVIVVNGDAGALSEGL